MECSYYSIIGNFIFGKSLYTGDVYMCRSTFYLLNIKISEININNR